MKYNNEQTKKINQYNRIIKRAVLSWENYNNSGGFFKDNSDYYYLQAESLLNNNFRYIGYNGIINIKLDTGVGLYPTIETYYNNGHHTDYTIESFINRFNGIYD